MQTLVVEQVIMLQLVEMEVELVVGRLIWEVFQEIVEVQVQVLDNIIKLQPMVVLLDLSLVNMDLVELVQVQQAVVLLVVMELKE